MIENDIKSFLVYLREKIPYDFVNKKKTKKSNNANSRF